MVNGQEKTLLANILVLKTLASDEKLPLNLLRRFKKLKRELFPAWKIVEEIQRKKKFNLIKCLNALESLGTSYLDYPERYVFMTEQLIDDITNWLVKNGKRL